MLVVEPLLRGFGKVSLQTNHYDFYERVRLMMDDPIHTNDVYIPPGLPTKPYCQQDPISTLERLSQHPKTSYSLHKPRNDTWNRTFDASTFRLYHRRDLGRLGITQSETRDRLVETGVMSVHTSSPNRLPQTF
jgi:hypothetical protein